jgi:hypothetical protein
MSYRWLEGRVNYTIWKRRNERMPFQQHGEVLTDIEVVSITLVVLEHEGWDCYYQERKIVEPDPRTTLRQHTTKRERRKTKRRKAEA